MAILTLEQGHRQKRPTQSRERRVTVIWAFSFSTRSPRYRELRTDPPQDRTSHDPGLTVLAVFLALTINSRLRIRPNWFLGLYTVLAVTSLMMSIRFVGLGTEFRSVRFIVFLFVLWLLTPWWEAKDLLFAPQSDAVPLLGPGFCRSRTLPFSGKGTARRTSQRDDLADLGDRRGSLRRRDRWSGDIAVVVPSGLSRAVRCIGRVPALMVLC